MKMRKQLKHLSNFCFSSLIICCSCGTSSAVVEKFEEDKVSLLCDSDVFLNGAELYYFQPLELSLLRPCFSFDMKKVIEEKLDSIFSSVVISFIKTYELEGYTFFKSIISADCGDILVCGLYSPDVFICQNFGSLTYIDFLFEGIKPIELGSGTGEFDTIVVYGEMINDSQFHIFELNFLIDLERVGFAYTEGSRRKFYDWKHD